MKYEFNYREIDFDEKFPNGLPEDLQRDFKGEIPEVYSFVPRDPKTDKPMREDAGDVLFFKNAQRVGVGYGDLFFADSSDVHEAIDCFINRPDEWEARQ
jgi:hypothetical protein